PGNTIQLDSPTYSFSEATLNTAQGFGSLNVTVTRTNATSPASVQFATSDISGGNECNQVSGQASQRCDYNAQAGTLRFAAGESSKTIEIPIISDGYIEGPEVFLVKLQNPVGATLGLTSQATVTILDRAVTTLPASNPYLSNEFFVRLNYLDFLAREPDAGGWSTWPPLLNSCGPEKGFLGAPYNCDRAHVSHGFYASPEFTNKGFLVYRLYEVGMGRLPRYVEFIPAMASLSGFGLSDAVQQQNLAEYLQNFTNKEEFVNRFQGSLPNWEAALFIQKLEQASGVSLPATATTLPGQPTQYGRQELINKRSSGEFTVGQTLKAFVEQQPVYDKFFPRGAVTMEYFAYLKRDPDLNDPTLSGWNEWVFVFTNGGAARGRPDIQPRDIHHLIFGFIYSEEYRKRFGAP
ncbi:MAG TPA: Calx-beta domain-containing protein, partial [Pyrinomonadaceae bacterium]|nr:Calx-beta domain-containing protein [Pyrinomonadaceae bacterium]